MAPVTSPLGGLIGGIYGGIRGYQKGGEIYDDVNLYAYVGNNPLNATDPDGQQAKELGRMIRALKDNDWDWDKAKAQIDREHEVERKIAEGIIDLSAVGIVKDAIEVGIDASEGKDVTEKGTAALVGEAAGKFVEKTVDKKMGRDAAEAVGAVVGEAVEKFIESGDDSAGSDNSPQVMTGARPPPPAPAKPAEPANRVPERCLRVKDMSCL